MPHFEIIIKISNSVVRQKNELLFIDLSHINSKIFLTGEFRDQRTAII